MNYLYQITNHVNNKIYIGVHKTNNIDDGYMGSGKIIKRAIEKHGILNFSKDILGVFKTYEEALFAEKEIVTDEFLNRRDVYNLRRGGAGGFDYINKTGAADIGRRKGHANRSGESIEKMRQGGIRGNKTRNSEGHSRNGGGWSDNHRILAQTPDAKIKRKESFSIIEHQQGDKNSQFGSMWITKERINKKIKKELFNQFELNGWIKGRYCGVA